MDFHLRSAINFSVLIIGMVVIGVLVSFFDSGITGAAAVDFCDSNIDCSDQNSCTLDICVNPDSKISVCKYEEIKGCG